jgi:lipopolysaccharide/colanic/teichoic acid biosynthesis glycosyltransferase
VSQPYPAVAQAFDRAPATEEQAVRIAAQTPWVSALPARAAGWEWRAQQRVKRVADIVLAAAGLIVLAPLFAVLAMCVALDSPGPLLYRWRVMGYRGRPFTGYKFRTMVAEADLLKEGLRHLNEMHGPVFKIRNDPRVTRLGRFMRTYSLDELPQLWSVLVGDMSLVGPRPPSAGEFLSFTPEQRLKLAVRPGITCLWQVSGRANIKSFDEWARLDLKYIAEWSLWLDVKLLVRTVPAVLGGGGAY